MGSSGSDPLVGLTTYGERATWGVWDTDAVLLPRTYTDAVLAAGGVPVLLPPSPASAAAVGRLDAVVLSGGAQCHHHQALDRLGPGLVVTGRADDGTVEAVELDRPGFVLGAGVAPGAGRPAPLRRPGGRGRMSAWSVI